MTKSGYKKEYTYKLVIFAVFMIIILGLLHAIFSPNFAKSKAGVAVLTEDTPIYFDADMTVAAHTLYRDDLVGILYEHSDDVVYIRKAATEIPAPEGYISRDKLSFKFDYANQATMLSDNVYTSPESPDLVPDISAKGSVCRIEEYYGDWFKISLSGGIDGVWARAEDLAFDLKLDPNENVSGTYYTKIKEYLQNEYAKVYKQYYDATVVNQLSDYHEEVTDGELTASFVMNAQFRNYYKDPDTVQYISDAKKMAEENDTEYYQKLYTTYYNEYNQMKDSNYLLKLTAETKNGEIVEDSIRLYTNTDQHNAEDWQELKNGFGDYIIGE